MQLNILQNKIISMSLTEKNSIAKMIVYLSIFLKPFCEHLLKKEIFLLFLSSVLPLDSLVVERRFVRPNDPESYAGKSFSSW
jgi:hypothetical protein